MVYFDILSFLIGPVAETVTAYHGIGMDDASVANDAVWINSNPRIDYHIFTNLSTMPYKNMWIYD